MDNDWPKHLPVTHVPQNVTKLASKCQFEWIIDGDVQCGAARCMLLQLILRFEYEKTYQQYLWLYKFLKWILREVYIRAEPSHLYMAWFVLALASSAPTCIAKRIFSSNRPHNASKVNSCLFELKPEKTCDSVLMGVFRELDPRYFSCPFKQNYLQEGTSLRRDPKRRRQKFSLFVEIFYWNSNAWLKN